MIVLPNDFSPGSHNSVYFHALATVYVTLQDQVSPDCSELCRCSVDSSGNHVEAKTVTSTRVKLIALFIS